MSITAWRECDRLTADAAINLNYNVLDLLLSRIEEMNENDSVRSYLCLITKQRYRNFLLTKKI